MFTAFKIKHPVIYHKGPAILFGALIFILSSLPGYRLPELGFNFDDKIIHMIVFGMFAIFLFHAVRFPWPLPAPYIITLAVGIMYAALDEFHQYFVQGRYSDWRDFVADTMGIIVFAGVSALLNPVLKDRSARD